MSQVRKGRNGRKELKTMARYHQEAGAKSLIFNIFTEPNRRLTLRRRDKEVDGRLGCHSGERVNKLNSLYGSTRASKMIRDELEACSKEKFPIAEADRLRLKDELGEDSFIRFNQYVNQRHWIPVAPRGPNPCPANHNPPPGQTTHLACTEFYVCFFEDFSKTDTWNQAMIRDGRNAETQVFNTFIPLPEAKKKADIALGLNAARDIKESFEETGASSQGPGTPGGRPREVIEEYIARLRQVLGEKQFREFDEILSGENNSMPSPVSAPAASGPGVPQ